MANDLTVSPAAYSPSVSIVNPSAKSRPVNNDTSDNSTSAMSPNVLNIQTTKELKQALLSGDPLSISDAQVVRTIERANKALEGGSTTFQFAIHKDTSLISIKIIDKDTGKVLKEIPSEQTLEMVQKMWELSGMLVDERR